MPVKGPEEVSHCGHTTKNRERVDAGGAVRWRDTVRRRFRGMEKCEIWTDWAVNSTDNLRRLSVLDRVLAHRKRRLIDEWR